MASKLDSMPFSSPREPWPKRYRQILIAGGVLGGLFAILSFGAYAFPAQRAHVLGDDDGSLAVFNATFGFGAIILISLPERTDRRDAMTLLTSLYNVSISHTVMAVRGEDIAPKALPWGKARTEQDSGHMGSWRSHMDAFKYIVDNRIETALVMEDDIDWDTEVRSELHSFSKGLRASPLREPFTARELATAPYGLDWDVMHLGNALIDSPPPPFDTVHTTYPDPFRNPASNKADPKGPRWHNWTNVQVNTGVSDPGQRIIIPSYNCLGLSSLAISYGGAQRLLHELSWMGLQEGLDWSVAHLLQSGKLRGWTVAPPLTGTWTVGGSEDSDIRKVGAAAKADPGSASNMEGQASNIAMSARTAMWEKLDRGEYWTKERFGLT